MVVNFESINIYKGVITSKEEILNSITWRNYSSNALFLIL